MKQGWEIKKLGDIAKFYRGLTYSKGDEVPSSTNMVLRSNNVDLETNALVYDDMKCLSEDLLVDEDKKVKANSILICMSNGSKQHIGKVAYIQDNIDYAFGGFMGLIVPTKDIEGKYLYYSCVSHHFKHFLAGIGNGIGITNLRFSDLSSYCFPVPPIAEQEKIVDELDCLSGIIEKKKQQLKELDNLAQSIFYEMFGDPVENDKGWDIVTLDDVFEIGSSKRVFESQWTDSGVPFYRAREIVKLSKGENIDSPIFISEELYHEYSRKYGVPAEGDMMVTAVGTLGVCYLVKNTDRFYFKDGNTLWFKSRGLCETRFIKDEFATDFIVNQIKGNANAAVVGTYTITNAKRTRVILPPLSLQQEYVRKIQHIDKQKELLAQSIKETETLFNSRMDYYFN